MNRIERIVVGVDLQHGVVGATARLAIEQAQSIAKMAGAHVTLVHSHRLDEQWNEEAGRFEAVAPDTGQAEADPLEQSARALRDAGLACDVVTSSDPPALAIVRQVLREGADLVVVGKRATHTHDGRHMGSVSMNVVRHAPCLVSVVKPGSSAHPKRIVAACDTGPVGLQVIDAAARLATLFDAELHAVHAIQFSMEVQMEGSEAEHAFVRERRDTLGRQVSEQAERAGFGGRVHVHAGVTTPTRAVLEVVEHLDPDIVVMGTVSRGGIPGFLVGNTAERLLGLLDRSLLVAKPDGFVCPVTLD